MSTTAKRARKNGQATLERFRAICGAAGVDLDKLGPEPVPLRWAHKPGQRFSELDQRTRASAVE